MEEPVASSPTVVKTNGASEPEAGQVEPVQPVVPETQSIQHTYQLSGNRILNNTPLLDALHDATAPFLVKDGYKTVNEDYFFRESRVPTTDGTSMSVEERFSRFTKLVSKNQLFEGFPITEARVKDIFNGVFIPNFSNYIDPADTSMENFVEFYRKKLRLPSFTLPFESNTTPPYFAEFSRYTYSLNFDKVLFSYFLKKAPGLYRLSVGEVAEVWNLDNYRQRHSFILNCIWQETLQYTLQQVNHMTCPSDVVMNNCEGFRGVLLASIEVLKTMRFTGFADKYKPGIFTTQPQNKQYKKFIYKHAQFTWGGHDNQQYPFAVSQKVCAEGINQILGATMKGRKGESSADKKQCYKGLQMFFDAQLKGNKNRNIIIACCYVLLKFLGDTSHIVNYRILVDASTRLGINFTTSLYCCERPLVVRSIQQNDITLYCKGINILSKLLPIGPGEAYEFQTDETIVLREKVSLILDFFSDASLKDKIVGTDSEPLVDYILRQGNIDTVVTRVLNRQAIPTPDDINGLPTLDDINNLSLFVRLYKSFESIQVFVSSLPAELTTFIQDVVPSALHNRSRGRVSKLLHIGPYISSFYGNMKNKKKYEKSCLLHTNFYMPLDTIIVKLPFIQSYSNIAHLEIESFLQGDMVKQHFDQINVTHFSSPDFSIDELLSQTMDNIDESTMHLMSDIIRSYMNIKKYMSHIVTQPTIILSGAANSGLAGGGPGDTSSNYNDKFDIQSILNALIDYYESIPDGNGIDIYDDTMLSVNIDNVCKHFGVMPNTNKHKMILRQLPFIKSYIEYDVLIRIYDEQEKEDIEHLLRGNISLAYGEQLTQALPLERIHKIYLAELYDEGKYEGMVFDLDLDSNYEQYQRLTEGLESIMIHDKTGYYESLINVLDSNENILLRKSLSRQVSLPENESKYFKSVSEPVNHPGARSMSVQSESRSITPVTPTNGSSRTGLSSEFLEKIAFNPNSRPVTPSPVKFQTQNDKRFSSQRNIFSSGNLFASEYNKGPKLRKFKADIEENNKNRSKRMRPTPTRIPGSPLHGGRKARTRKGKFKYKHNKNKTQNKKSRGKKTKKKQTHKNKSRQPKKTQKRRQRKQNK